ncbi:hypothetical protein COLSTE_00866 [Collinsella stercoris DSM 13279]|uniref:Uncharacterized protein n=1 Tax=Collinsella stercoris DSM 13279 TaxID=445975 RepID=B6G9X5_9ACTN|nr:hypothetical protein COLSTE_00866 [Collinsella stercoris DSM 13279]
MVSMPSRRLKRRWMSQISRLCNEFSEDRSRRGFWVCANWGFNFKSGGLLGTSCFSLHNRVICGINLSQDGNEAPFRTASAAIATRAARAGPCASPRVAPAPRERYHLDR